MRLLVAEVGANRAAIVREGSLGLRAFEAGEIQSPPVGGGEHAEHMLGVVPISGSSSIHLIDLAKLLEVARERAVSAR